MDNVIRLLRDRLMNNQETVIEGPDKRISNPALKRSGDLGPKQLEWCRAELKGFASHERQAESAKAHSEQSKVRS